MLASSLPLPADTSKWALEVKWDGLRALAVTRDKELTLLSRNGTDITATYPEIAPLAGWSGTHEMLLDGEIVVFDGDGRPDFAALQRRMHVTDPRTSDVLAGRVPVTYVVFDVLAVDGRELSGEPYANRRAVLDSLRLDGPHWVTSPSWVGTSVDAVLGATQQLGQEGVVAKRVDSTYEFGRRSPNWRKVKHSRRQEFVVGGWTPGQGERTGAAGALLLGVNEGNGLRYVGKVNAGTTRDERLRLLARLAALAAESSPFAGLVPATIGTHWTRPELVVEVEFGEWTANGRLRHPVYRGLRNDKTADDVVCEG